MVQKVRGSVINAYNLVNVYCHCQYSVTSSWHHNVGFL